MTIVADSGSTKTMWMEVESGNKVVTEGLNPHFTTDEQFLAACAAVRQQFSILNSHFSIHFYGAGCGLPAQRRRVAALLAKAFGTSDIHVETDMLGACRAVCGNKAGLVGILGTGSNACYFDGEKIVRQAVSTGYILGDHGSANHVGRKLLHDYLTGRMPYNISTKFHDDYPMTNEQFMDAVYHQPNANRFLASLAPFALRNYRFTYCFFAIVDSLKDWYNYQLWDIITSRTDNCRELNIVGGFGAAIGRSPIERFEEDCDVVVKKRLADPIDGLREYHRVNLKLSS